MANVLKCSLFGNPEIRFNEERMLFSFSKIDALLYYLLVTKSSSRDELAGLLWPDKNEQNAKKNLRNAIYQANKLFGVEVISSPNKALLTLNEDIDIFLDVDLFMLDARKNIEVYQDIFLKGFFLKDCEDFEYWIIKMRSFYEKTFLQECHKIIESDIENGQFQNVEKNIQRLINIDEFDESNYQLLMRFYQLLSKHEKVVETFFNLSNLLKVELGIMPNKQSKSIYEISLEKLNDLQNNGKQRFNSIFFARIEELTLIETMMNSFKQNLPHQSILISGEAGIGKSALVNVALDNLGDQFTILETQCYQVEEKYILRPWKQIIDRISELARENGILELANWQEVITMFFPSLDDHLNKEKTMEAEEKFPLNSLTEVISEALNQLGKQKKIILVFEDIQWMDKFSLDLLSSVMISMSENVLFMMTSRNEKKVHLEKFTSSLIQCGLLLDLRLNSFTYDETADFIQIKLPNQVISPQALFNVYKHTEGNLFFLMEYVSLLQANENLNTMTVKMKDALKNRFLYLTENEQAVVNLASYFYDYVLINDLVSILNIPDVELVDLIESLVNKNILKELMVEGEVAVTFTHIKLREFIYMNQLTGKKRLYHNKIAECLENRLSENSVDHLLYDTISYHYKKGRQELKSLIFKLKYLEKYLGFYHELFPVEVKGQNEVVDDLAFNQENVLQDFKLIKESFNQLEEKYEGNEQYKMLYCEYLYLEGRFLIKYGEYHQGVENIKQVISISKDLKSNNNLLLGYKQMIYYYIQIDEPDEMIHFIELALDLSIKENNHQSVGVLLRLKGLYEMMSGNNWLAEKLLKESINTFMLTESIAKKYAINIAAAYNYLGEIRFNERKFDEAYQMFQEAIDLCSNKKYLSSLSVFYTNIGATLYAQGKFDLAETSLLKALSIYKELNTFWKRPRLDAYLALVYLEKEDQEQTRYFLNKGQEFTENMKNDRDEGIVAFSKAIVSQSMTVEEKKNEFWSKCLSKTDKTYAKDALMYLNEYQDLYERNLIEEKFILSTKIF